WRDHVAVQHKSSEYVIIHPQLVVIIEIYGGKNQQVPEAFDPVPDLPPPPSQGARAVPGCLAHPRPGAAAAGAGGAGPGRPRAPLQPPFRLRAWPLPALSQPHPRRPAAVPRRLSTTLPVPVAAPAATIPTSCRASPASAGGAAG